MVAGPDPNKFIPPDPDAEGDRLGDPPSTRFGLGSTAIVVLLLALVAAFFVATR